jgi:hypothetical protein
VVITIDATNGSDKQGDNGNKTAAGGTQAADCMPPAAASPGFGIVKTCACWGACLLWAFISRPCYGFYFRAAVAIAAIFLAAWLLRQAFTMTLRVLGGCYNLASQLLTASWSFLKSFLGCIYAISSYIACLSIQISGVDLKADYQTVAWAVWCWSVATGPSWCLFACSWCLIVSSWVPLLRHQSIAGSYHYLASRLLPACGSLFWSCQGCIYSIVSYACYLASQVLTASWSFLWSNACSSYTIMSYIICCVIQFTSLVFHLDLAVVAWGLWCCSLPAAPTWFLSKSSCCAMTVSCLALLGVFLWCNKAAPSANPATDAATGKVWWACHAY